MYFILSKAREEKIDNNNENQIISLSQNTNIYILPYNNLDYYKNNGLFERQLIEWCKQFCDIDKNFIDIGAHTGTYSISLADKCKKVFSFEPQRMTFYSLCGSVALSNKKNIECINIGLGSKEQVGKQILNVISVDGGGSSIFINPQIEILDTEEIDIKTLDSFNLTDIGFIKIDVENNELFVISGGTETLKRNNYPKILFESNFENETLMNFIESLGYRIITLNGVNNMFLATF
jgi:FkbM family methyltransferase